MVASVRRLIKGWKFDAVSIGYPGPVLHGKVVAEPHNLGRGWVGFDFRKAFGRPTLVMNDAAMQAIGSYEGGRMLFLGLGTGLGTAMVVNGIVEPMEIAHLPFKDGRTYEDFVGEAGRRRLGTKKWRRQCAQAEETAEECAPRQQCLCVPRRVPSLAQNQEELVRNLQPQFIGLLEQLDRRVGAQFLLDRRLMVGDRLRTQAH